MSQCTPKKCEKVFHQINGYLTAKDNHDSWGMCIISVECRTVMTAMLMVMSGMDPHTIRETLGWCGWDVGSLSVLSF
jgi:hypothetical protein